ncbi:diguanylate phosphodiesterase [Enterobacteriaceae bacterium 89]|nr:diguanylate phosphodiesterase [Enterobacteriaceae bacterium 89]
MLTTIIYRSHLCDNVAVKSLEGMVASANLKNGMADVTGILLFNGTHFFQLLEGPEDQVKAIYRTICEDKRHYNVVELLCDYAPARRFGKVGMEIFDLREHDRDEVLQTILDKGTSRYQLTWNDRALQFFRTFVEATEKENYFEIPPADSWEFIPTGSARHADPQLAFKDADCGFAFQPIIDPLSQEIVSVEALVRTAGGGSPKEYFDRLSGDELYQADLDSKKVAFALAKDLGLSEQTLAINLLPMTLVNIPDASHKLLQMIEQNGLVPEQVIVEFTENEVISQFSAFTQSVRDLKASGISVSIDHFGAGYAGLQLLARFQPDRIKISQELIRDVHKSGPRQAIIQALIKCCASLEIAVSVVGVEKAEEWMWLESAGIFHFQGHLFAEPCFCGVPAVAWPEKKTAL